MPRTMHRLLWLGWWILAHTVTFAIATAIDFSIMENADLDQLLWMLFVVSIINGCCTGSVEAWLLRRLWRNPGWWLVATVLATPAGIALGVVVLVVLTPTIGPALQISKVFFFGLAIGAVVGTAQYPFLRRHLRPAAAWIAIAGIGRGSGWAAGLSLAMSPNFASEVTLAALGGALGGAIYGAITGSYLQLIIPIKKQTAIDPQQ